MNRFMDVGEQHRGMGKDETGFSIAKKIDQAWYTIWRQTSQLTAWRSCCHAVRALRRDTLLFFHFLDPPRL